MTGAARFSRLMGGDGVAEGEADFGALDGELPEAVLLGAVFDICGIVRPNPTLLSLRV